MTAFNPDVNENPSLNPRSVTLLKSNLPLRKVFNKVGEAKPIRLPKTVSASHYPVMNLGELHDLLIKLTGQPHLCIIRGGFNGVHIPGGHYTAQGIRRKSKGADAPIFSAARSWVCFDVDGVTVPDEVWHHEDDAKQGDDLGLESAMNTRESRCRNWLLNNVLGFMGEVSCIVQWSSSCFLPSKGQTISAHVWYWLSEPLTDLQIRFWVSQEKAKGGPAGCLDASLARAVQPHFTADPDLSEYMDPIKGARTVLCPGECDEYDVCDVLDAWDEYGEALEATKAARAAKAAEKAAAGHNDLDQQKVIEALAFVSADCDYETWLAIGMAIHSAWPEDGFDIWDSWSSTGPEYVPGETEAKWASFNPDGGVGLGTVFHHAVENGYEHTPAPFPASFDPHSEESMSDHTVTTKGAEGDYPVMIPTAPPAAPAKKKGRAQMKWYKHDIHLSTQAIMKAIAAHYNHHPRQKFFYNQNGQVTFIQRDQEGEVIFSKPDGLTLRGLLCKRIDWQVEVMDKEGNVTAQHCDIGRVECETVLRTEVGHKSLPLLRSVIRHLSFGEDGTLQDVHGYREQDACLVIPPKGRDTLTFPETPTGADVKEALDFIFGEWLSDFPFVDESSKAHTLALALAPMVRSMVKGNTPLHVITAPRARTGKTKLAQCIALAHTGKMATFCHEGSDERDWKAQITSSLAQAPSIILIDNLSDHKVIKSDALCKVLTTDLWDDRMYGKNTERGKFANTATWVATVNNPRFSNDLTGRMLLIELDPKCPDPSAKTNFKHANIEQWTKDNAEAILSALATLVRAWISQGKPVDKSTAPSLGSFEGYVETLHGIFQTIGVKGLLENRENAQSLNSDGDELTEFVLWWWSDKGKGNPCPMTPKEMLDEWDMKGLAFLGEETYSPHMHGRLVKLGNLLKRMTGTKKKDGTPVGNNKQVQLGNDTFIVVEAGRTARGVTYKLQHIDGPNEGYGEDAPGNPFDAAIKSYNKPIGADLDDAMEVLF